MKREQTPQGYEKPEIIDYGTLVELTASQRHAFHEDGVGKNHDLPHHSHPHR